LVNVDNVEDIMNYYNRNLEQEQNNKYERIINNINIEVSSDIIMNNDNNNSKLNCDCNICYETYDIKEFVRLNCNHTFCKGCIKNTIKTSININSVRCALCREVVNGIYVKNLNTKFYIYKF